MAVRYALIAGSYRQQLNFTTETLHAAQSALAKLERFASSLLDKTAEPSSALEHYIQPGNPDSFDRFSKAWEALSNNLNTSAALGALFGVVGSNPASALDAHGARQTLTAFGTLLYALGLKLFTNKSTELNIPEDIRAMGQERWEAKQARDYARADDLRDALLEKGWTIKDNPDGFEIESK